jgi:hypothetical protein
MFFLHAFLPFRDALGIPMICFGSDKSLLVGLSSSQRCQWQRNSSKPVECLNTATVTQRLKYWNVGWSALATSALAGARKSNGNSLTAWMTNQLQYSS